MPHSCVALVESNTTGTGAELVEAIRRLGFEVFLICRDPARYQFVSTLDLEVVQTETARIEDVFAAVTRGQRGRPLAGVSSSSDFFVEAAATVAEQLGLPGPRADAVRGTRDKLYQRRRLRDRGLPVPAFAPVCDGPDGVDTLLPPLVIKPRTGSGSMGVRLCHTTEEARAHATALAGAVQDDRMDSTAIAGLAEEYVDGDEYSVEVFDGESIATIRKHVSIPPFFVEIGHDCPAALVDGSARNLVEVAEAAVEALDLGWGPAHVELRLSATTGRPVVIEVNPRLAGGLIPHLVRHAFGIDLIDRLATRIVGQPALAAGPAHGGAAIRFLLPSRPGVFVGAEDLNQVLDGDGIVDAAVYPVAGTRVVLRGDFRDRLGHVIARAPTADAAARLADAGLDNLRSRISFDNRLSTDDCAE